MLNYLLESIKYSWVGGFIGILGAILAWIGGKTYSNANQIVVEKLDDYVKKEDYKEDMQEIKESQKEMSGDIKILLQRQAGQINEKI